MATSQGDLIRILDRILTERINLAMYLDHLTTGDAGILHEMKLITSGNGQTNNIYSETIGNIGTEVRNLSKYLLNDIDSITNKMKEKIDMSKSAVTEAITESQAVSDAIKFVNEIYSNK